MFIAEREGFEPPEVLPSTVFKTAAIVPSLQYVFALSRCGGRGIRTPDTLLTYTRFPGVPLQPLEHHSKFRLTKVVCFSFPSKFFG